MDATQVVFACKRDNCLPPRSDVPGLLRINLVVSQRAIVLLKISHISTLIAYPAAPVVLITDSPALILITFSSSLLLLASLVGVTGTLLNSRPILAIYVLCQSQRGVEFLVLCRRADGVARHAWLLRLEWATSRCVCVWHVLSTVAASWPSRPACPSRITH